MGKFIDTQYTDIMNSLIDGFKERLKSNNLYAWNDKNNTIVTYYNVNTDLTTLDPATLLAYENKGEFSGIKFNKVNNFMIYGLEKIAIMLDTGDFGLEATEISGDAYILPNTIIPYTGDFFIINHEKEKLLFKVINVHPDTLDDGANFYRIEYKVTDIGDEDIIANNIAFTSELIFNNIGTNLKPVIMSDKYRLIKNLDDVLEQIKSFYTNLFYTDRVQTFIFKYGEAYFYDPFMIEFLIRTKILSGRGRDYIYLNHQIPTYTTFSIDYERSFFRLIEEKNKESISRTYTSGYGELIQSKTNIFSTRYEDYFKMVYRQSLESFLPITIFDTEFIQKIKDGTLYENDILYNILIKYFNNMDIEDVDIKVLDNIDYENNVKLFYTIPCVIFCLETYIKSLMS